MSILNFSCTPERVLLAVDTLARMEGGLGLEATKLIGLAHLNVLLAGRGRQGFFHAVVNRCLGSHLPPSLDAFLEGAHSIVADAVTASADYGATEDEIVIAGWSDSRQRMVARRFFVNLGGAIEWADRAWGLAPGECFDEATAPRPANVETMIAAARLQVQYAQETWKSSALGIAMGGECPIGGRLLVAELTRARLTVECVAQLTARMELPAQICHGRRGASSAEMQRVSLGVTAGHDLPDCQCSCGLAR